MTIEDNLADLSVVGLGIAFLSRTYCPNEVAEVLGSHEARAYVEHFITAFSVPTLFRQTLRAKYNVSVSVLQCALGSFLWESHQSIERDYFQYGQFAVDLAGYASLVACYHANEIKMYSRAELVKK